jgi:diguanylate cyclase (GGDEF)-like protein
MTPEIAIVFNRDRRPVFINPAFSALWEDGALQVNDVLDIVHPDDRHGFREAIRRASRRHRSTRAVRARVGSADNWQMMSCRLTNLFDDAAVAGMVLHARDTPDQCVPERSGTPAPDVLMTLLDRRALLDCLGIYHQREQPISLLACGLDSFSLINQSLGRSAGDGVLAEIAARLVSGVHEGDTIGRLGGDEFAVVCPHLAEGSLEALLTTLDLIFHDPVVLGTNDCVVTASIGIARLHESGGTIQTVAAAEAAMRLAKDRGRDRVELCQQCHPQQRRLLDRGERRSPRGDARSRLRRRGH